MLVLLSAWPCQSWAASCGVCLFATSADTHERQTFTDEAPGLAAVSAHHVSCSDCAKCGWETDQRGRRKNKAETRLSSICSALLIILFSALSWCSRWHHRPAVRLFAALVWLHFSAQLMTRVEQVGIKQDSYLPSHCLPLLFVSLAPLVLQVLALFLFFGLIFLCHSCRF